MNSVDQFNSIEIGLWAVFGLVVMIFGHRSKWLSKIERRFLAIALLAFAYSDYVELHSGAWWRPLWLLVLKGGCLCVFAAIALSIWYRSKRQFEASVSTNSNSDSESIDHLGNLAQEPAGNQAAD